MCVCVCVFVIVSQDGRHSIVMYNAYIIHLHAFETHDRRTTASAIYKESEYSVKILNPKIASNNNYYYAIRVNARDSTFVIVFIIGVRIYVRRERSVK